MVLSGKKPIDEPPFFWMQGAVALLAFYMTLLILVTQQREDQLAGRREQLTLKLAILGEQKSAKIIELIEEMRRDLPMLNNRIDHEAAAMAVPGRCSRRSPTRMRRARYCARAAMATPRRPNPSFSKAGVWLEIVGVR